MAAAGHAAFWTRARRRDGSRRPARQPYLLGIASREIRRHVAIDRNTFREKGTALVDPHGFKVALVEDVDPPLHRFTPWDGSPVPQERQIRGLYGAQLWERHAAPTAEFLTEVLGFQHLGTDNGWARYGFADVMGVVDVRETPNVNRGAWGVGCVHHLAWRVDDDEHQLVMRRRVQAGGGNPTPVIDRFWFKSVYFREPGGVLFEIATDGPGFAIDEDRAHLGEALVLAPFLEPHRAEIERALPPLTIPTRVSALGSRLS
jgi:glyoxalase family protein